MKDLEKILEDKEKALRIKDIIIALNQAQGFVSDIKECCDKYNLTKDMNLEDHKLDDLFFDIEAYLDFISEKLWAATGKLSVEYNHLYYDLEED